jgi:hypothetical protein
MLAQRLALRTYRWLAWLMVDGVADLITQRAIMEQVRATHQELRIFICTADDVHSPGFAKQRFATTEVKIPIPPRSPRTIRTAHHLAGAKHHAIIACLADWSSP